MDASRFFRVPAEITSQSITWANPKNTQNKEKYTMGIKGKVDRMVVLACEDCKERNYTTVKNKKTSKERMELKKYCPSCKSHKPHKETK